MNPSKQERLREINEAIQKHRDEIRELERRRWQVERGD